MVGYDVRGILPFRMANKVSHRLQSKQILYQYHFIVMRKVSSAKETQLDTKNTRQIFLLVAINI